MRCAHCASSSSSRSWFWNGLSRVGLDYVRGESEAAVAAAADKRK